MKKGFIVEKFEGFIRIQTGGSAGKKALLFHGYGGCKEEMLKLGLALADFGIDSELYDLPGHGDRKDYFSLKDVEEFLKGIKKEGSYFLGIGHSIGARLICEVPCRRYMLLSPPLDAKFEGSKKELLRNLRVRRVKEKKPFQGLEEILTTLKVPELTKGCAVVFYSFSDLKSVQMFVERVKEKTQCICVKDSFHLDIVTSPEVTSFISELLKK